MESFLTVSDLIIIDMENDLKECISCLKEAAKGDEIDTVWLQKLEEKYYKSRY